jgi:asparagine synthase (glutamine-hydrolysing)
LSALVGFFNRRGHGMQRANLDRMIRSQAHRGPDGSGAWCDDVVGLGHLLLRTVPDSDGEQPPVLSAGGDLVITADVRLDNRDELVSVLGLPSSLDNRPTDAELILAAYERWGEVCPERLLGDFAFAIWDRRRRVLFCARDHVGVKPFYYWASPELFACATEIKALFCLPAVPRRINEARIGEHLISATTDVVSTVYAGILRLAPAHSLTVSADGISLRRYWELNPTRQLRLASDDEYTGALRELFVEAVRCRTRGNVPIGSMLSGGIDSSSIACVAQQVLAERGRPPLHTFSAVFDGLPASDERQHQQAVLAHGQFVPHIIRAGELSPVADLDRMYWHFDQITDSGNLYLSWNACGIAREHGVRIMLDGFDGDTTLSHGNGYLPELALKGHWLTLAREVRAKASMIGEDWRMALWAWVWLYGVTPTIERSPLLNGARSLARKVRRRRGGPHAPRSADSATSTQAAWKRVVRPEVAKRLDLDARSRVFGGVARSEREHHFRRLTLPIMPFVLEVLDSVGGAHGVEMRYPFWDRRLIEFCLALPPEQKMRGGWTRFIMRRAMEGILPPSVQWRPDKANLHQGFEHGLRTFGRTFFDGVILGDSKELECFLDMEAVRGLYARFAAGEAIDEDDVNMLWRAASVGLWLRRSAAVIDSQGKEVLAHAE